MRKSEINTIIIDGYVGLLDNLSSIHNKLDLIFKLTASVKSDLSDKKSSFKKAFGAFDSKKSAQEIIEDIGNPYLDGCHQERKIEYCLHTCTTAPKPNHKINPTVLNFLIIFEQKKIAYPIFLSDLFLFNLKTLFFIMKKLPVFALFFAVYIGQVAAFAQQIDTAWTRNFGGIGSDAFTGPSSIGVAFGQRTKPAINKNNDIFIATFSSSLPSGQVRINYGQEDILVLKLNQNGDTLWSRTLGGIDFDRASGALALGDGGCIVVGRTTSTTFRHQNGVLTFPIADGNPDLLVFRLSPTGTLLWAKTYGTNIGDELNGILRTHDKNIVVYGQWGDEACALKMDTATGADIWSQKTKISSIARADTFCAFTGAAQLRDSSIVFVGSVYTPIATSSNDDDMITCRMNKNGGIVWTSVVGTTREDRAGGIVADSDSNFVYVAGRANFGNPGDNFQIFVARLNGLNGTLRWARNYGAAGGEGAFGIDIDAGRRLYAFGRFHQAGYGHPAAGFGVSDYALLQIKPTNGDTLDTYRIGGIGTDECSGFALNPDQTRGIMVGMTQSTAGRLRVRLGGGSDIGAVAVNIPPVVLEVDSSTLMLAGAGGTNKSALRTNGGWNASFSANWLTVVRTGGFGNDSLRISAAANTGTQRTATVTLRAGFVTRVVTVIQKAVTSTKKGMKENVRIFPNPSSHFINILFDKNPPASANFVLVNAIGQQIICGKLDEQNQVNVAGLSNGIYKLKLQTPSGMYVKTIQIAR